MDMDRIVLVREKNYKEAINLDECSAGELAIVSKLALGFSQPLGKPSHKNGTYARVLNEQTVGNIPHMTLLTFPYSSLDPTLTAYPATMVVIATEYVEEATNDPAKIDELINYEKIQKGKIEEVIETSFQSVFPDMWDRQNNDILVHFPELVITNSAKHKHIIRDLFVKFVFDMDTGHMMMPLAARTTRTYEELINGYSHSHVQLSTRANWGGFCFGETAIANTLLSLRSKRVTLESLSGFLFQFDDYIHWESREGGPYFTIDTLGKVNDRQSGGRLSPRADNEFDSGAIESGVRTMERILAKHLLSIIEVDDLRVRPAQNYLYSRKLVELDLDRIEVLDKIIALSEVVRSKFSSLHLNVTRDFNISKNTFQYVAQMTERDVAKETATDPNIRTWYSEPFIIFKGDVVSRKVVLGNIDQARDRIVKILLPRYLNGIITQVNAWLTQENLLQV